MNVAFSSLIGLYTLFQMGQLLPSLPESDHVQNQGTITPPTIEGTQAPTIEQESQGESAFDLPVVGATGYTVTAVPLYGAASVESGEMTQLSPGTPFRIVKEEGDFWHILWNETSYGYVQHKECMINLPDVLPSAVYYNSNGVASEMRCSTKDIPSITGEVLYQTLYYNQRLGQQEHIMPVLYSTAKKIALVQKEAMSEGNTLVIYELFRPSEVQNLVKEAVYRFSMTDPIVNSGLQTAPWSISWFISTGVSNHQKGLAIDASLAKILATDIKYSGNVSYEEVTAYQLYEMPTEIHELSMAAVSMVAPIPSTDSELWKTTPVSTTMNENALLLRKYCTNHGFTPIASEWWHFNDLGHGSSGMGLGHFIPDTLYSVPAEK